MIDEFAGWMGASNATELIAASLVIWWYAIEIESHRITSGAMTFGCHRLAELGTACPIRDQTSRSRLTAVSASSAYSCFAKGSVAIAECTAQLWQGIAFFGDQHACG